MTPQRGCARQRSVAAHDSAAARPAVPPLGLRRAGNPGADPHLTPFPVLLQRARRRNQRRLVASLGIAIGLLAAVVVWFVASGIALGQVAPTLMQAVGQAVADAH